MGKERRKMIFEEKKDGMLIRIPHNEMMNEDVAGFMLTILQARNFYQRNKYADLDDDDSEEE